MLTVGSLFSGIGGIDLGLQRAGMEIRWQCECEPYCLAVLAKHWPDVKRFTDIKTLTNPPPVDVLAGGPPCQPVSVAGKRKGQDDARWLWPEFARLIRVVGPRYVLLENVPGLLVRGMGDVLGDLASLGYDAEWRVISAADMGAPHLRRRVWIVAYPQELPLRPRPCEDRQGGERGARSGDGSGHFPNTHNAPARELQCEARVGPASFPDGDGRERDVADTPRELEGHGDDGDGQIFGHGEGNGIGPGAIQSREPWPSEPDVCRMAYGVPNRVERLRALGNAVVPQIVEMIGRQIIVANRLQQEVFDFSQTSVPGP